MTMPLRGQRFDDLATPMLKTFDRIVTYCTDAVSSRIESLLDERDDISVVTTYGAPPQAVLRATTLNIGAASLHRATDIMHWLRRRDDDVIVLTETSAGSGTRLLAEGLAAQGYEIYDRNHPGERGVLLATRLPVALELDPYLDVTVPSRVAGVLLDTDPAIAVMGVYVPSRDRSEVKVARKRDFITSLLSSVAALPGDVRERLVLAGDYNAIPRDHEPRLKGFYAYEYELHDELEDLGLAQAHEILGHGQQHSWIGRTGNGYLYDYVHVGPQLHPLVERCAYLHGPRTRGLSDHAAVALRLRLE